MITLCLIRHAKSDLHHLSLQDKERRIDKQGEEDAITMGQCLSAKGLKPNLIMSSPAIRAQKTAELIATAFHYPPTNIEINERIYEAGVEQLLHLIQEIDKKNKTVFVVGHNPGLTLLANYLADDHMINLTTCGVYCIDFKTDKWDQITVVEGKTRFIESPKTHQE